MSPFSSEVNGQKIRGEVHYDSATMIMRFKEKTQALDG